MPTQPILLNRCAEASTSREAGYRIDAPIAPSRGVCVLALDRAAAVAVRRTATITWASARFFTISQAGDPAAWPGADGIGRFDESVLDAVDAVLMVATGEDGAPAGEKIGRACAALGVMTTGVVLGDPPIPRAIAMLRPYARILLATSDEQDITGLLTALRA